MQHSMSSKKKTPNSAELDEQVKELNLELRKLRNELIRADAMLNDSKKANAALEKLIEESNERQRESTQESQESVNQMIDRIDESHKRDLEESRRERDQLEEKMQETMTTNQKELEETAKKFKKMMAKALTVGSLLPF
jgi:hypothetical protein